MRDNNYYETQASYEEYIEWYQSQEWSSYDRPSYTADMIALKYENGQILIPIIKRLSHPFKECYALPGGFVDRHESAKMAIVREVKEEIDLDLAIDEVVTLDTYDEPNRDPRGWVVSKSHLVFLSQGSNWSTSAGDDAKEVHWLTLDFKSEKLFIGDNEITENEFAFDHYQMIIDAIRRIKGYTTWNTIFLKLLGEEFIVADATDLINTITNKNMHKSNFLKIYSSMVEKTGNMLATKTRKAAGFRIKGDLL